MRRILPLSTLLLLCAARVCAQEDGGVSGSTVYPESDPMNVAITARGGVTFSTARGTFPSLIIGESRRPTGSFGQEQALSGIGSRVDIAALIPFDPAIGIAVAIGSQRLSVDYPADSVRVATRFDVQSIQAALGVHWSALHETSSYAYGGMRSIYVDAGIDIGLATLGNRVEGTTYDDTLGGGASAAAGSFANSDAFRSTVALRGGVGLRFAPSPNLEVIVETTYSYGLNAIFSSEAIKDNDFTLDVLRAMIGVGYRF